MIQNCLYENLFAMETDILKNILPSRFFEVLEKAGINTPKQIILLSPWDIKKATKLLNDDILLLKTTVSRYFCPISVTCDIFQDSSKVKIGCAGIDKILEGGFRRGVITEIYGESGSGKTQIAMQTAAYCGTQGSVIICTEGVFPVNRFKEISLNVKNNSETVGYGNELFIEHITEAHELLGCVRVRLQRLLSKKRVSALIIDSVAAPFRSEYTNYVQRAEELRELAIILLNIAQEYNLAVICLNQVTAAFDDSDNVLPTLGLVWSNMISCRLKLRRLSEVVEITDSKQNVNLRELSVIYSPDLPSGRSTNLLITAYGVKDVV